MAHSRYLLKNCEICGAAFWSSRAHATTCSPKCRMKKMRQGRARTQKNITTENVTNVTLSYLDWLIEREVHMTMPVAEDWQNT